MTEPPSLPTPMPIMTFFDIQIGPPVSDGVYTAVLAASPNTLNLNGVVHGAAIAALVDHAAGFGMQQLIGRRGVTTDLHVRYLGAARAGSVLTAESRVVCAGRTQIVMEVKVLDDTGRLVAVADLGFVGVEPPLA